MPWVSQDGDLTEKGRFQFWFRFFKKTVPTVPVPPSVCGITVPTVLVSGSWAVLLLPEIGVAQTVFLEKDDFAFDPPKTKVLLLRPPKTTKLTKMAGVTQAKAWFRKNRVCFSLKKGAGN